MKDGKSSIANFTTNIYYPLIRLQSSNKNLSQTEIIIIQFISW